MWDSLFRIWLDFHLAELTKVKAMAEVIALKYKGYLSPRVGRSFGDSPIIRRCVMTIAFPPTRLPDLEDLAGFAGH